MTNLLHLADWNVLNVKEANHEYAVEATYTVPPEACVHCGAVGNVHKHGTRRQEAVDVPSHGNRVRITVVRTRHWCKDCGKTFLQPLPDLADSGSMTRRCVSFIERQSLKHTFAHVADEVGVDEKTVRNIFNDYIDWLDKTVTFQTPEVLGLDELYLLGKPRCIATNITQRTIIELLEDRNKPSVNFYLHWLPDKERIKVVTMDMWKPDRDAVKATLPGTPIVVDKFHIVRTATNCLEAVRRGLRDEMTTTKRREVMRSRFLLLKRTAKLTGEERERVEEWTKTLPTLGMAYRLKEGFYSIFDLKDKTAAAAAYDEWEKTIPDEMRPKFKEVTSAMKNWREEVLNYFTHGVTNATTEALNGLSKIANRSGRGYSFRAIRAKMLYGRNVQVVAPPVQYVNPRVIMAEASRLGVGVDIDKLREVVLFGRDDIPHGNLLGASIDKLVSVLESEERKDDPPPKPTPWIKREGRKGRH